MRDALPPPSTASASGGVSEDAPICNDVCELCGAPISVQGCTCLRERRQRGVSKQNDINNSYQDDSPRRKSRYRPRPKEDGVPRRSKRLAKRQERTRAYRTANDSSKTNVKRAMAKMKSKLRPDPQLILDDMNGVVPENQANQDASESTPADVPATLRESERRVVEALGEDWRYEGFGTIPLPKPDGTFRIMLESINSMMLTNKMRRKGSRHEKIDMQCQAFEANVMCHLEPQQNWSQLEQRLQYDELFGIGQPKVSVAAHNTHDNLFDQPGGTAMIALGELSAYAQAGKDELGLGRAVWILFTYNDHKF